jgi:spermidine/putrescine transport system permease protein
MTLRILKRLGVGGGIGLIMLFLYVPAILVALYSFNHTAVLSWPPRPDSLQWYGKAFSNPALVEGLKNSGIVALISVTIAILIGLPVGLAVDRFNFWGKTALQRILMLPFVLPGLIGGLTLLTVFLGFSIELSLVTVIITHATMLIALVVIQMAIVLARWNRSLEDAGRDLGAGEIRTFMYVTWPNIRAAIFGAALLGIAVSLEETERTVFVVGEQNTLPIVVLSGLRKTLNPAITAMGTVVVAVSLVAIAFWTKFGAADLARE